MKLDIGKGIVHIQTFFEGRCPKCNSYNKNLAYDYGKTTIAETEKAMDKDLYPITPLICRKCGTEYNPKSRYIYDVLRDERIATVDIEYGNMTHPEQFEKIHQAHNNRFEHFKEHENDFWQEYYVYALEDWRQAVNELRKEEIEEAYERLGISARFNTVGQYRKDVLQRFKSSREKQDFWRHANDYFIYGQLLDLGIIAWDVGEDVNFFGKNRMRFAVLNFPIDEALEPMRTMLIGSVVRHDKGDNSFLFRRIEQLTKEIETKSKKITDYFHMVEEQKYVIAELQQKLHTQYQINKQLAHKDKTVYNRDPKDILKIAELKSFIGELLGELKKHQGNVNEENNEPEADLDAVIEENENWQEEKKFDFTVLDGKTICIFGGDRQKQASNENYPCKIITHSANKLDPEFYQVLKQADVLVVLTEHISHMAMWTIKAYAIENDVPMFFQKNVNIEIILSRIAQKQ